MDLIGLGVLGSLDESKASDLDELIPGQVGVLVVGHGESLGSLRVVLGDEVMVISEVLKLMKEISTRLGLDLVLLHPVEEFLLIEGTVMDIGRGNCHSRKGKKFVHF